VARPSELTGAIVEPCAAGDDAGAGCGGGFCAPLWANAGEIGPATSKPAKKAASRGLANAGAARFAAPKEIDPLMAACRMNCTAVSLRVLIVDISPSKFLSLRDAFILT
jgi:hypothetical protein